MDVAFVVDEEVTHEKLSRCICSAGGKLLSSAQLFDVYRDEKRVGAGKKSMAYALEYRAADRTLTTEEVDKHTRVLSRRYAALRVLKFEGSFRSWRRLRRLVR